MNDPSFLHELQVEAIMKLLAPVPTIEQATTARPGTIGYMAPDQVTLTASSVVKPQGLDLYRQIADLR